jgi:hypothetical protein
VQVPTKEIALNGDPVAILSSATWSTTERQRFRAFGLGSSVQTGDWVQVSRLGNPLVNEVVVPARPEGHVQRARPARTPTSRRRQPVTNPRCPADQAIYGLPAPATPRNDWSRSS